MPESRLHSRLSSCVFALALVTVALLTTSCASFYVDSATKEVPASLFKKPVTAKPVQVLFEFQTKGALNAKGTEFLKAQVIDQVKTSGLFSAVEETPVADGALLTITINNVPVTDDAFAKGFVTGLTFGSAGSQVTDGFVCTMTYRTTVQPQPRSAAARASAPTGGSFSQYLRETLIVELKSAGLLNPASPAVITGFLTESEVDSGMSEGSGKVSARFVVTRSGSAVYDRELSVSSKWPSSFVGAVAIPAAINEYTALYRKLVGALLDDQKFQDVTRK